MQYNFHHLRLIPSGLLNLDITRTLQPVMGVKKLYNLGLLLQNMHFSIALTSVNYSSIIYKQKRCRRPQFPWLQWLRKWRFPSLFQHTGWLHLKVVKLSLQRMSNANNNLVKVITSHPKSQNLDITWLSPTSSFLQNLRIFLNHAQASSQEKVLVPGKVNIQSKRKMHLRISNLTCHFKKSKQEL